jgi:adenosylcobinamide-phosphate synthase
VFVLLAQRSLHDHVLAVATGFQQGGLEGGRDAVAMIVGRDPAMLDESGIVRASIESLAENFSDGVVAPAFWYCVFGLPGLFAYKMINTADSMIGYRNEKYLWFGRAAAQIDDLANWLPARLSTLILAGGVWSSKGNQSAKKSIAIAFRDAGLHRSPNAGWPEASMAGGMDVALGGPRRYPHETVQQAYINASGRMELSAADIKPALNVFAKTCGVLWALVFCLIILGFMLDG